MLGTYEYPDFPMASDVFGIKPGEYIPGEVMNRYLTAYTERFDVFDKIRRWTIVEAAEHQDGPEGGWVLTVRNFEGTYKVFTAKLVVATGLTSEPFLPYITGQETFRAPRFYRKDFIEWEETLDTAKRVTVFRGTKSAWDVVYTYASRWVKVDWVIRGMFGCRLIWFGKRWLTDRYRERL